MVTEPERVGDTDRPVLAVDIGGTKLAAGLVQPDGTIPVARRAPTPRGAGADAETLWSALVAVVREVLDAAGRPSLGGVGCGCGGPMSWPTGEVSPVHIPGWRGFPLRARLAAELRADPGAELGAALGAEPGGGPARLPVRVHNDAVCLAVAEHWRGAARGHRHALGMVVSTGVGGGLVLGDGVVDGDTGNAGHVGHIVVDPDGPRCPCGNRGCVEILASGPAIARCAVDLGWRAGPGMAATATARDAAAAARAGEPAATAAFDRAGRALGLGIAAAVTLLDVSVVTIGGGVAEAGDLLFEPLRAAYADRARLPYAQAARVVPAALGPAAGLLGAAALVLAGTRYWNAD